jgi:hypothetical protein
MFYRRIVTQLLALFTFLVAVGVGTAGAQDECSDDQLVWDTCTHQVCDAQTVTVEDWCTGTRPVCDTGTEWVADYCSSANYVCDTGSYWVDDYCQGSNWVCDYQRICEGGCDDWGCWESCWDEAYNCREESYSYVCGGHWEEYQYNCRWESYTYECGGHWEEYYYNCREESYEYVCGSHEETEYVNCRDEQYACNPHCPPPPPPPVHGCTDPNATNYSVDATIDDGSCTYPPPPELYAEFSPSAAQAQVEPGEGDLIHGLSCYGWARAPYSWAPISVRVIMHINGTMVASQSRNGYGFIELTVNHSVRASTSDREFKCTAQTPGLSDKIDVDILPGVGPPWIRFMTGAFIPDNWVDYPPSADRIFGGDDRSFEENTATARMAQSVEIRNSAVANALFVNLPTPYTGLTQEYARCCLSGDPDPFPSALTEGMSGVLKQEAIDDWIRGLPLKVDWGTAPTELIQYEASKLGPGSAGPYLDYSRVRFVSIGRARDPLVAFSPYVDYRMEITLTFGANAVTYRLDGCHDAFPAYEAYLGGRSIYAAPPTGNLMSMFADCGVEITTKTGVIQ